MLVIALFAMTSVRAAERAPVRRVAAGKTAVRQAEAAESADYAAVGTLKRGWSKSKGRYEYSLADRDDGMLYTIFAGEGVDLASHLGKTVGVVGESRRNPRNQSGYIRAEAIEPVQLVGLAQYIEGVPEEFEDGMTVMPDECIDGDGMMDGSLVHHGGHAGACGTCGGCVGCGLCGCGPPGWSWVQLDYLNWWNHGMRVPPLVTTSPIDTTQARAGVLGQDGTTILLGHNEFLDGPRSGGRIRFGTWIDTCRIFGVEGEYFGLGDDSLSSISSSAANGTPILARPFFNINPRNDATDLPDPPAREDSELVSFPNVLAGSVRVDMVTSFLGGGARARFNLSCNGCPAGPCNPFPDYSRIDLLLGYRFLRLREGIVIREDLTALDGAGPQLADQRFQIFDSFATRNEFHGGEIGAVWEVRRCNWSLETLGRIAMGNNHQTVTIRGQTQTTNPNGGVSTATGGLLAQRTNIGEHTRDVFAVVPELGVNLGWFITPRLRATVGYSFIYFGRVVRPGDHIDTDVNPDLLPPEASPFTGSLRPRFAFRDSDFWAHGWNVGMDYRW